MAMGMRRKKGSEFWAGVAQVYGDLSAVKKTCGSCQKAWEVLVDYVVMAMGKGINGKSAQCVNGLYAIPKRFGLYAYVWMSMNEKHILAATYQQISASKQMEKACFGRVLCNWAGMHNEHACVANMVNLAYRDISVGLKTDFAKKWNSKVVTADVKSYLKSALEFKYNCAPKASAHMWSFAD